MSPIGGFTSAILGTLLGGRNKSSGGNGGGHGGGGGGKKYEKLETDDPAERKRQEATHEEIQRLNFKIVSHSHTRILGVRPSRGFDGKSIREEAASRKRLSLSLHHVLNGSSKLVMRCRARRRTDFIRSHFRTPSGALLFRVVCSANVWPLGRPRPADRGDAQETAQIGLLRVRREKAPPPPAAASCSGVQTLRGGAYDVTV